MRQLPVPGYEFPIVFHTFLRPPSFPATLPRPHGRKPRKSPGKQGLGEGRVARDKGARGSARHGFPELGGLGGGRGGGGVVKKSLSTAGWEER